MKKDIEAIAKAQDQTALREMKKRHGDQCPKCGSAWKTFKNANAPAGFGRQCSNNDCKHRPD